MTWMTSLGGWRAVAAIGGGALGAAFLWWAVADLFLATVEFPFAGMLERWRQRRARRDERDGGAGASAPV